MDVVGRDTELAMARQQLDQVVGGVGSCLQIVAGPGTGKTALVDAVARHAADAGCHVHAITITEW